MSKRMQRQCHKYDFFEGKNGTIFYRPSAKFSGKKNKDQCLSSSKENSSFVGSEKRPMRAFERNILKDRKPKRMMPAVRITSNAQQEGRQNRMKMAQTEKKMVPLLPRTRMFPPEEEMVFPRQSISERKPIPGLDKGFNRLAKMTAKKTLFEEEEEDETRRKESFEFARPLSPAGPGQQKSKAELILLREGLAGMPRESMSLLLRQSLSKAELDRMFEDDSTESFEALERRIKTPSRNKKPEKQETRNEISAPMAKRDSPKIAISPPEPEQPKPGQNEEVEKNNESELQKHEEVDEVVVIKKSKLDDQAKEIEESQSQSNDPERTQEAKKEEKNKEHGNDRSMVNVEIFEFDDGEVSFMHRSLSMADLSTAADKSGVKDGDEDKEIHKLARSTSEINLRETDKLEKLDLSEFLRRALQAHAEHVREQTEIEKEMKALMEKARRRREVFKANWGVSPRNVNRLRTLKTVTMPLQEVTFSEAAKVPKEQSPGIEPETEKANDAPTSEEVPNDDFPPPVEDDSPLTTNVAEGDFSAQFDELEDLIFNTPAKDAEIDPEISGIGLLDDNFIPGCQMSLEDAFDDILGEEEMEITQVVGEDEQESSMLVTPEVPTTPDNPVPVNSAIKKSVRFKDATPLRESSSGEEQEQENEWSFVTVSVPVQVKGKSGNITFSATGRTASSTFLRTQTPAKPSLTNTPMALRNITNKAQQELALLYASEDQDGARAKIDFEGDSE